MTSENGILWFQAERNFRVERNREMNFSVKKTGRGILGFQAEKF